MARPDECKDDDLSLTREVARFASQLSLADVPAAVRAKAKLHILDTVGCGIAGADSSLSLSVLRYLDLEHGAGIVPVLGDRRRYGPAAAAFANSTAMNALDFDDGFEVDGTGMGHPGATIVAAALSGAYVAETSGERFLAAVIAAYEVNHRLIYAMQPSIERFRQVYGVCQHQAVGAAVAYGKLSGLDSRAMENAIGLAATLTNVPSLRKYNFTARPLISFKDFNGPAAEAGVRAVQMHQCGIVGSKNVLDGPDGLWRMLGSDRFDAGIMTAGLGRDWLLLGSTLKPYPVCRWMHTAIEAFAELVRVNGIKPGSIDRVVIHTSAGLCRDFMDASPSTMVDAQFSFPFAIAALVKGFASAADWYRAEALESPEIHDFAKKVTAEWDPEVDRLMGNFRRPAGRVSIVCKDRVFASPLIEFALGSKERPLGSEAVEEKFFANVVPVIGQAAALSLKRNIEEIEASGDIRLSFDVADTKLSMDD